MPKTLVDEKDQYAGAEHHEQVQYVDAAGLEGSDKEVLASDFGQYIADASDETKRQKEQTVSEAIRMYRPGIIYSLIFSAAIIMEGFDTLLLGQFYAQPAFAKRYGSLDVATGTYQIPAKWQTGLSCAASVGQILGLQITGWASDRFGYKKTMLMALTALTGLLFLQFFAQNLTMLLVAYILLGFPWGTFQTMTVAYAAELMPVQIRPFLTTYVNLCWVIGQIICSGVNKALIDNTTQWAYKIPFALQWIWPIPICIGILLAPESPWWLTRKGKLVEAERALLKCTAKGSGYTEEDARKAVAMMHHTNQMEIEANINISFLDCFKGVNLRRTEIACIVWLIQNLGGSALMGQGTYFLEQAGLSASTASTLNLCMFAVGACGTVASWPLMQKAGRRTIYLWGQVALAAIMLITGLLGVTSANKQGAEYAIGALLILFTGLYDLTVGPVCYSLVAEIGSTRLRAKTVVLARNLYNVAGIVVSILNPYMLNPTAWNWGAKSALLWFGLGSCGIVWTYFRLPEPKGRSYAELDVLFDQKVPARQFSKTAVDPFAAKRDEAHPGAFVH